MKPENSGHDDAVLSGLLREWKVDSDLPPRFSEQVWRRIERGETAATFSPWASLWNRIAQAFARPSLAAGYVAVLLLAGLAAGYFQARIGTERVQDELSTRYVQMVDPYQRPPR